MRVTETPKFQQQYELSEHLEIVLGSLPWPAIVLDASGTVTHVNEGAMALAGTPFEGMIGRHVESLFPVHVRALRGDPPWMTRQEVEVTRSAGHGHIHERVWVRPIPGGAYLLVMDETPWRESEHDRAQTARLASIGFMLAGVCHEVSNPLAAIYSMVQILQSQDKLNEQVAREGLDKIAANVKRILEVSRRINEFCRIGKPAPVRVDFAVEEALALLREDSRYSGIIVQHHANSDAIVSADMGHLRQVFYNLALNACQAMAGEGVIIIRSQRAASGLVKVFVEDTGPGIRPETLEKLFEPFFTTKPSGEGTGLGLSITRDLVREHGGAISVRNRVEGGACFCLEFPGENFSP